MTNRTDPRYLLILSATCRDGLAPETLQPWCRYNGPLFSDLRAQREAGVTLPAVIVFSAGYRESRRPGASIYCDDLNGSGILPAGDPRSEAMFRRHFEATRSGYGYVISVAGCLYDSACRDWLKIGEGYRHEAGHIDRKRWAQRAFLETVAQANGGLP